MEIKLKEILVRDVYNGYVNDEENGVVGYGSKLNIRPKFQREFVYNDKQQRMLLIVLITIFHWMLCTGYVMKMVVMKY